MTEFEIIKNIKDTYNAKKLNEANTRYKIIDTILQDILKWPKEPTIVEQIVNGIRSDYILHGKNNKPVLIIESKKTGTYFNLPNSVNSKNNYQKVTVNKLLSDKYTKEAIYQVKEYCEDIMCNYGCVCNGFVWIFFCINSHPLPWKEQQAFVIRDLSFFFRRLYFCL